MFEKILAALKLKYKNLGLSDKTLEGVARMLAATITEEANIETGVAGVEDLLKGFQSDADKRVTDAVAKAKKEAADKPKKEEGGAPEKKDEPAKVDETPEWAKGLTETIKNLQSELTTIKASTTAKTRKQALEEKLKDANPAFKATILENFELMNFETEETFEAFLTKTETKMTEFNQSLADQGLSSQPKPLFGSTDTSGISSSTKQYIESKKEEGKKETPLGGKPIFQT